MNSNLRQASRGKLWIGLVKGMEFDSTNLFGNPVLVFTLNLIWCTIIVVTLKEEYGTERPY